MVRFVQFFLCLGLLFLLENAAQAEDFPRQHNEYHNSTIYNGMPQQSYPQQAMPDEGISVYRDPDTGDRVISVRSRLYQDNRNNQQMPIYIDPIIRP